ncbi:sialidase family protein [uncultured Polaribacter sp.]|uniref:sialidase family protein n=1 Tax=uncultured Polaribacter sp. TaxID=174711 RepID=UPI00262778B9|nr:sialidase family protein [uncultured Polaribacter sp.]
MILIYINTLINNRIQNYSIWMLLLLTSLTVSCSDDPGGSPVVDPPEDPDALEYPGSNGLNYLFSRNQEGYAYYRIPALLRVDEKTLLAFAEGRKEGGGDSGNIDLVVRRSEDNGFTWSKNIIIWDDGGNTCGNPSPIYDKVTGEIILLSTWNAGEDTISTIIRGTGVDTRRPYVIKSTDKGVTWSNPVEITASVKRANWRWYATGPGSGIQIRKGPYKDRLIVGCNFINSDRVGSSHIIYSDDHGENWAIGGVDPEFGSNECEAAELSNNDIMLNSRNGSQTEKRRRICISNDGGLTLQNKGLDNALISPRVQASLHRYSFVGDDYDKNILLFSNPADLNDRKDMTIKLSEDDGDTWTRSLRLNGGFAAYSDLENYQNGHVAILYEAGDTPADRYQGISFETISLDKID